MAISETHGTMNSSAIYFCEDHRISILGMGSFFEFAGGLGADEFGERSLWILVSVVLSDHLELFMIGTTVLG